MKPNISGKNKTGFKLLPYSMFTLCNKCLWSTTYFDKNRIPRENRCPLCGTKNNELSSLPIMSNESFAFSYDAKRGLEIELLELEPNIVDDESNKLTH